MSRGDFYYPLTPRPPQYLENPCFYWVFEWGRRQEERERCFKNDQKIFFAPCFLSRPFGPPRAPIEVRARLDPSSRPVTFRAARPPLKPRRVTPKASALHNTSTSQSSSLVPCFSCALPRSIHCGLWPDSTTSFRTFGWSKLCYDVCKRRL